MSYRILLYNSFLCINMSYRIEAWGVTNARTSRLSSQNCSSAFLPTYSSRMQDKMLRKNEPQKYYAKREEATFVIPQ